MASASWSHCGKPKPRCGARFAGDRTDFNARTLRLTVTTWSTKTPTGSSSQKPDQHGARTTGSGWLQPSCQSASPEYLMADIAC